MNRPDPEPVTPELPPQRAAVLAFLRQQLAAGRAPSLAEIAEAFGFASRNAAQKHVQALLAEGLLEQVPGRKRGLRLPGGVADLLSLPVLGRVAAGAPVSAEGAARAGLLADPENTLWLDRRLFLPRPDYLLRVQGDSMIDDGIVDGDLVGVQRTPEARDGQTVVARVDGELTIKRLQHARGRILLLPRNRAYAPIEVGPGQDFAIEGVYCGLLRRG